VAILTEAKIDVIVSDIETEKMTVKAAKNTLSKEA